MRKRSDAGVDLEAELRGMDLDELQMLMGPPHGYLAMYTLEEAGPLDEDGVPWWFPHRHPDTGELLARVARKEWLEQALLAAVDLPGVTAAEHEPGFSDQVRGRQLAILKGLLFVKWALDEGILSGPDAL